MVLTVESAQVPLDGLLLVTARPVRGDSDPEPGTAVGEVREGTAGHQLAEQLLHDLAYLVGREDRKRQARDDVVVPLSVRRDLV